MIKFRYAIFREYLDYLNNFQTSNKYMRQGGLIINLEVANFVIAHIGDIKNLFQFPYIEHL